MQFIQRGDRGGRNERAFPQLFSLLNALQKHFDGESGVRPASRQWPRASRCGPRPGLFLEGHRSPCERQSQPALAIGFIQQFLKRLARADGHGIVLRADQINYGFMRSRQFKQERTAFCELSSVHWPFNAVT